MPSIKVAYRCDKCARAVGASEHVLPLPGWHLCLRCWAYLLQILAEEDAPATVPALKWFRLELMRRRHAAAVAARGSGVAS